MLASLALPCACWVALYRDEIPGVQAAAAGTLAVAAVLAGGVFTAVDILKFFEG